MPIFKMCSVFLLFIFPVASLAGTTPAPGNSPIRAEAALAGNVGTGIGAIEKESAPDLPSLLQLAQNDREGTGETTPENPEVRPECSWGTFWDVHFGGYRWIWWAAAGGALIAIHAH